LSVNEKNSSRDNLSPKLRWKLRGEQKGTGSLENVAMLMLSNTILSMSMSIRARELS